MGDGDTGAALNSYSSTGKLHTSLLVHQMSDNTPPNHVTLRMNRDFMKHMRLNYPDVIKSTHPRYGTIHTYI